LSRGDLTEVEWRILKVLLPVERKPGKRGRGRPPEDNRNVINGILWRLRTGAPWRDVPEKYGNWNSIYRRFRRWSASGVWESVAIALAETMAESGHYNIDSTTVRAHVSAAGGKGGLPQDQSRRRNAIRSTRRQLPRHAIHRFSALLDQICQRGLDHFFFCARFAWQVGTHLDWHIVRMLPCDKAHLLTQRLSHDS
jgi:transposase